jgi:hypothetical protein
VVAEHGRVDLVRGGIRLPGAAHRLALDTVLTDATGKGRSPEELATMELAPLVGTTGKAIGTRGADFWKQAVAAAPMYAKMPFMAGTLMHGIPAYATVRQAVRRAGQSDATANEVYAAVLGHHMSGFIAGGFSKSAIRLDFPQMLQRGDLSHECSASLAELYDAAIELGGRWRDILDAAAKRTDGPPALTLAERERYFAEAARYRAAIDRLPEHVRSQLINDDTQQFTPVGIPKWLGMMAFLAKPTNNQALLEAVYRGAVQPYYEENIGRGTGMAFYVATLRVAVRLGMRHLDDAGQWGCHFRPAVPGEPEHRQLAWQVANDEALREQYLAARNMRDFPEVLPGTDMVTWLRALPPDPGALGRLAAADLPPAPPVMK